MVKQKDITESSNQNLSSADQKFRNRIKEIKAVSELLNPDNAKKPVDLSFRELLNLGKTVQKRNCG